MQDCGLVDLENSENLFRLRCENKFISELATDSLTTEDVAVLTKYSVLCCIPPPRVLWYLCNAPHSAAPSRESSTEDGLRPHISPGPPPRFLRWRDKAPCSPPGWATPPNYGSHCCLSDGVMHDGKSERQMEDKRSGVEEGQRDAERISMISRCTDVPRSKDDIKLKPFISPCHNGNLRTICFQFQKGSLFMSRPLSIYTSLIKTGCGKKRKKESNSGLQSFKLLSCCWWS